MKTIILGPPGTGKTLLAKTLAHDNLKSDKSVLFLCFNKLLGELIKFEFENYDNILSYIDENSEISRLNNYKIILDYSNISLRNRLRNK